jgi:outer membrane receptor protein involved in Fe transport
LSAALRRDLLAAIPAKAVAANPNISPGAKILRMWDTGATMSGPLLRDRLWFAATGKLVRLDQLRIGSYNPDGTQFIDDNAMKTASIRGSWAMNTRRQLHYTHLYNKKERFHYSGNVTTEFAESRATVVQNLETHLNQARWTTTLSPRLVLDIAGSQTCTDFDQPPQPEVSIGDVAGYDSLTQTRLTAASTYSITRFRRMVVHAGVSYVVSAHDLKVGYQLDHGKQSDYAWSMSHFPSGLRAIYRNGVADSVNTYNTPTNNLAFIQDTAVFLQDKWTPLRRLTVNVGLRVEKQTGWQPEVCQVQTIFIDARCFDALEDVPNFFDPAPR